MRSVRPPPRVVPPGPPAHLFEPAEDRPLPRNAPSGREYPDRAPMMQDFSPRGNEMREAPAPATKPRTSDFDRDVEEQMRAIEDNLRQMLEAGAASPALPSAALAPGPGPRAPQLMSYSPTKQEPIPSAAPSQYAPPERSYRPERMAYDAPPMYVPSARRDLGEPLPKYEDESYRPTMHGRDNLRMPPQERALQEPSTRTPRAPAHGQGVSPQKAQPADEGGLPLGMDKHSEKELKRRKQEEYKRQLDEMAAQNPRSHSKLRGGRQEPELQNPYASPRRQERPRDRAEEPRRPADNAGFPPNPAQRRMSGGERPLEADDPRRNIAPEDQRRFFDSQPARHPPRGRGDVEIAYDDQPGRQRGDAGAGRDHGRHQQEEYRRLLDQDKTAYLAAHRADEAAPPAVSGAARQATHAVPSAAHVRADEAARRRQAQEDYRHMLDLDQHQRRDPRAVEVEAPPPASNVRAEEAARRRHGQEEYRRMLDKDNRERLRERDEQQRAQFDEGSGHPERPRMPSAGRGRRQSFEVEEENERRRRAKEEYRRQLDQQLAYQQEAKGAASQSSKSVPEASRGYVPSTSQEHQYSKRVVDPSPSARPADHRPEFRYPEPEDQSYPYRDAPVAAAPSANPSDWRMRQERGGFVDERDMRGRDEYPPSHRMESAPSATRYPEPMVYPESTRHPDPRQYSEASRSYDDEGPAPSIYPADYGRDGQARPADAMAPSDRRAQPAPGAGSSSIASAGPAPTGPVSPSKPARARLVTDLYGQSTLLAQGDMQLDDKWRPSRKNADPRQREAIADQRAALQQQIEENQRRKEREKEEEKRRQEQLAEEIRRASQLEEETKRAEREKKQQEADLQAREMMDLQTQMEKEALARKNRGLESSSPAPAGAGAGAAASATPAMTSHEAYSSQPQRARMEHGQDPQKRGHPAQPVSHLAALSEGGVSSPLRDMLHESEASYPHGHASASSSAMQRAPYGLHSAQAVNNFMAQYQHRERGPREEGGGDSRAYTQPYGMGRNDYYGDNEEAHYRDPREVRDYDRQRREAPPSHSYDSQYGYGSYQDSRPREDYPRERYAEDYGYPPEGGGRYRARPVGPPPAAMGRESGYGHPGSIYPETGELSVASESRLIQSNPWQSAGIIANLVPLGTSPERAMALGRRSSGASRQASNGSDLLEKSMASASYFTYMGAKTPAGSLFDHDQSMQQPPRTAATAASVASVSTVTSAVTTTSSRPGISYNDQDAYSSSQNRSRIHSKQQPRLHPESLPPAGMTTTTAPSNPIVQGEAVQVTVPRRVIQQVVAPTADEIPMNRIFLQASEPDRDQQNIPEPHHVHPTGRTPGTSPPNAESSFGSFCAYPSSRPSSGIERSSRPASGASMGREPQQTSRPSSRPSSRPQSSHLTAYSSLSQEEEGDDYGIDRHAVGRRRNVHEANSSLFKVQPAHQHTEPNTHFHDSYDEVEEEAAQHGHHSGGQARHAVDLYGSGAGSRPMSREREEREATTGSGRAKRWELSAEERQHTIKRLAQHSVANILSSYGPPQEQIYSQDSFEEA